MPHDPPRFELRHPDSNGAANEPEIFPVLKVPLEAELSRRDALALGAGLALSMFAGSISAGRVYAQTTMTKLLAHNDIVSGVRFSTDGNYLASSARDKMVKLWKLHERELKITYRHDDPAVDVAVVSDPARLVSVTKSGIVRSFGLDSVALVSEQPLPSRGQWWALSSNGSVTATAGGNKLSIASMKAGAKPEILIANLGSACTAPGLVLSPDGSLAVVFLADRSIQAWAMSQSRLISASQRIRMKTGANGPKKAHHGKAMDWHGAAISSDNKRLAVNGNGSIQVFSLPDLRQDGELSVVQQRREALALSASELIAIAETSSNPRIQLWSMREKKVISTSADVIPTGVVPEVTCLSFDPKDQFLVSGHVDGTIRLWSLPRLSLISMLFDRSINPEESKGISYEIRDAVAGIATTYTLPCGSPIPAGAVCTCNCIGGTFTKPVPWKPPTVEEPRTPSIKRSTGRSSTQPCGTPIPRGAVCTCNCVPVCQAHRLLDDDPVVRTMAETIVLTIGKQGRDYLEWAAAAAAPPLRDRIQALRDEILRGRVFTATTLPEAGSLSRYLHSEDEIAAIMAAQCLTLRAAMTGDKPPANTARRVQDLLCRSAQLDWRLRTR